MENKEMILVTDWERVQDNDFYLSKDWGEHEGANDLVKQAIQLQKENNLYVAYIVPAVSYAIYTQMDAKQVFIDGDINVILECENSVISNNHQKRVEYSY